MSNATQSLTAIRETMRRLAEAEPTDGPVVSAYLDLRPGATENPQVRTGQIVLRDTMRAALDEAEAHTPEHESLSADTERIEAHVENELLPGARGAAVFASSGANLFESVATAVPLDNDISVGQRPRLLPLARLAAHAPAIVALVDSSTLRLFTLRSGALEELGTIDEEEDYQRTSAGGWSQARYQRRVDEQRERFAELAAEAIEENLTSEGATTLLIAGDEVAVPLLTGELSKRAAASVRETVRADMRATIDDLTEICLPVLERIRNDDARDAADRLVGAVEADGMGVTGLDQTRSALEIGQALELIVDESALPDREATEDLIRQAVLTDAPVRFVTEHAALAERGGVGALLRFRLDRAVNESTDEGESQPTLVDTGSAR